MASEKLRNAQQDEDEGLSIDMSPMIDVVFLLLIFFIVSSHLIITKIDADVKPPKAKNAVPPKNSQGRIVLNIHEDGKVYDENAEPLSTDEAITAYVEDNHQRHLKIGVKSRLHVRADREVAVEFIKKTIQAAGEGGVNEVIFGAHAID